MKFDMTEAHAECERYAGAMEAALESVRQVCRLATLAKQAALADGGSPLDLQDIFETFAVIDRLCRVKDDRKALCPIGDPITPPG